MRPAILIAQTALFVCCLGYAAPIEAQQSDQQCKLHKTQPVPVTTPVKNPGHTSMWVTRTDTPIPFWIALPTEVKDFFFMHMSLHYQDDALARQPESVE